MNQKLLITKNDKIIFDSKLLNIPIKEDILIKRSIELFDDEDPCIIHQSYIVKEFAQKLLELFDASTIIEGEQYQDDLNFLDFTDIDQLTFRLER
ncbi:MAG: hypothetical protein UMR38_03985 [Candidatus Izemoplasma sp.]|nr:hypothetical protein [Candidatus Izemoplasma sp.]